ncbi:hypothetical protein SteCoe_17024 [Stentor coeruleus]|uniref:Uncharacterized protein n=1 Tax=Stentor coeruleus TaxID=5963 RepID=A0A1R2BZY2_9CILI|nr:hypothetical protein SteCoe_17024 [Stentor coeruleus]
MDKTPLLSHEGMKQKAVPCMHYLNILGIPFIISLLYALFGVDKNDCEIGNTWLYVELIVQVVITVASISQISKRMISKSNALVKVPLLIVGLFQIIWLILGVVWIFDESLCVQSYNEALVVIAAIAIVTFASILVFLVLYIITVITESRKKKH